MVKDIEKQMQENGLDVSQFYSMSLKIPLGSTVELKIDGKKIDVKNVTNGFNDSTDSVIKPDVTGLFEQINDDGYVRNSHLWRRWITAQTFKMLNYKNGWNTYVRENFSWKYCIEQLRNEFYAQWKMLSDEDTDEYCLRSRFFNKDVLIALIKNYIRQLYKTYNKGTLKKIKSVDMLLNEVDSAEKLLNLAERSDSANPYRFYELLGSMSKNYTKLPMGTPLCREWLNAYRGSGAYYTLKNLIMWHGVKIKVDDHFLNTDESLRYLFTAFDKADNSGREYWRLQELLKATIVDNDFDLAKRLSVKEN